VGDLSKNLSRHEFACKCGCGFDIVDYDLVRVLQSTADWFYVNSDRKKVARVAITINSGCRCPAHNKNEGGSKSSRHMLGNAADFKLKYVGRDGKKTQINPDSVADYLDRKFPNQYGVGWYNGRTHFDVSSSGRRRWRVK
jgi:uncharacterized protein YcbK (DUF882 family)